MLALTAAFALCAAWLCWHGVQWAFASGGHPTLDEIGNLPWPASMGFRDFFTVFPRLLYNDRPLGSALEFFLYRRFGFDYVRQLTWFVPLHFANCALAFLLFRRIGLHVWLSLTLTGLFGTLATTAVTATYLGASFDVLCTLFLLGSTLLILGDRPWHYWLSALLYYFALRSKEFAIVAPLFLTLLVLWRAQHLREVARRLWPHYAILAVFAFWYPRLAMTAPIPAGNPYHMDLRVGTALGSLAYYTALIFELDGRRGSWIPAAVLAAIALYAAARRRVGILFAIAAYVLTLLPPAFLPALRSSFYTYCPQIFLLLAIGQALDGAAERSALSRALAAALVLGLALKLGFSPYFQRRVAWYGQVRAVSANTAAGVRQPLGQVGPHSRLYLNHGADLPYLLIAGGPCHFLHLLRHEPSIECVMRMPYEELRRRYEQDRAEKYFVDYHPDGTIQVVERSGARPSVD